MSDEVTSKFARCAKCGALADVEGKIVGWNQRDIELCKNPPIRNCTNMRAALKVAKRKGSN
jgi:hypothetical protein